MNRVHLLLALVLCAPAPLFAEEPPPDTLAERLTRLAASASEATPASAAAVRYVQIWTPDSPVCGLRAYTDGRLLHARGTFAKRSRPGGARLAPLFAAAAQLALECPHASSGGDLLFKVNVDGQRYERSLSSHAPCPRAAALAREALRLLGSPLPEAPPEQAANAELALPQADAPLPHPSSPRTLSAPQPETTPQIDTAPHVPVPSDIDGALLQLHDQKPAAQLAAAQALRDFAGQDPEQVARRGLNPLLSHHDPRVRGLGLEVLRDYDGQPGALDPVLRWQKGSKYPEVVTAVAARQALAGNPPAKTPDQPVAQPAQQPAEAIAGDEPAEQPATGEDEPAEDVAEDAPAEEIAEDAPAEEIAEDATAEEIAEDEPAAESPAEEPAEEQPAEEAAEPKANQAGSIVEDLEGIVIQDQDGSHQDGLVPEPRAFPTRLRCVIHANRPASQRKTLRVRTRPVNGGVVGGLRYGQEVEVTGPAVQGYYPIRFQGRQAFVSADPKYVQPLD